MKAGNKQPIGHLPRCPELSNKIQYYPRPWISPWPHFFYLQSFSALGIKVVLLIFLHIISIYDTTKSTLEMKVLDNFANFVYTWVGRFGLHRKEFTELMLEFAEEPLAMLHIHGVF